MDGPKFSAERSGQSLTQASESARQIVFQPQKLKEVVEIIDLMGNVASRVREDSSGDMGAAGAMTTTSGAAQTGTGTSTRDEAIAKAPPVPIMQKKLVQHLEQEIRAIERQARSLARSDARGSAYLLNELYRKVRRLTSLISEIFKASAEVIKRFYVSVFIDRQPMTVTGGSLVPTEQ